MHAKSWPKTLSGHDATYKNSTKCERSFRQLVYVYKLCGRTNKWRRPCAEPLGYVPAHCPLPISQGDHERLIIGIGNVCHEQGHEPPGNL